MSIFRKIFPPVDWLEDYDRPDVQGDLSAGLTVGVMLIPQSMAYAMLAGVPPIYGLYAGLVPLLVYALLGSSRHLAIGPVAVDMVIVSAGVGAIAGTVTEHVELAILAAAMTGVIEILMGVFRFGFMVNFLSRPVIAGFMTAAPLIIAASQIGNLIGVELVDTQYVHLLVWSAINNVAEINVLAFGIGLLGIVFLVVVQQLWPKSPGALVWVVGATFASWALGFESAGVDVVGEVPHGLPSFVFDSWSIPFDSWSWDSIQALVPTALTLALVQFMTVMSLSQAFAADHDYSVDANRELFAIGSANVLGSLFRSIPISGSFSRSAVNDRSGANTPVANIVAATLVGLTLLFLTPLFQYLPISALAAIIMVACIGMIDVPELRTLLETRWIDGGVALLTFAATLVIGIQQGILIGVGTSILVVLYDLTRPNIVELGHVPGTQEFRDLDRNPEAEAIEGIQIIRIDARFSFANAKLLKEKLLDRAERDSVRALVIDTKGVNALDTTASQALREVVEECSDRDTEFYVAGAKGPVRDVFRRSGLQELIGESNFYLNAHLAVSAILEDWEEEEEYEPVDQEQRREQMEEAREKFEKERKRIRKEHRAIEQERRRLQEELDQHEGRREALEAERQRLREELSRAEKRREQLQSEREDYEKTQKELDERRERLDEREESLDQRSEELKEFKDELEEQQEELEEVQEQLESQRDDIGNEHRQMVEERDELEAQIEQHLSERDAIDAARDEFQQQLHEAERRRDELRSEREKIERQQEELEEERKRLEEQRRQVEESASEDEEDSK